MLQRTFFAVAVIVLVARVVGLGFRRFHQPQVIGEIVGGIILGPTVIGLSLDSRLFPADVRPSVSVIGQLGLVLYMFMIGLHLNVRVVRMNPRTVSVISTASILTPFVLAMPLAAFLYSRHGNVEGHHIKAVAFYLFLGTAMSITAFPVLARILEERELSDTRIGIIATACAAVQDVVGWFLLAVILTIARAHGGFGDVLRTTMESIGCVGGIFLLAHLLGLGNRMARRWALRTDRSPDALAFLLPGAMVGLLASAGATQAAGLHAVFGAFLFGALLRRHVPVPAREPLRAQIAPITTSVLLPVYFITPGLSVDLRTVDSRGIVEILLILLVACVGKLAGGTIAARAVGLSVPQSRAMGALMNTRGLVELVVLQVALAAGIIDDRLFSEMVLMAVVTTLMTQPLLSLLTRSGGLDEPGDPATDGAVGGLDRSPDLATAYRSSDHADARSRAD